MLKWLKSYFGEEIVPLVEELKNKYQKGFVAHVSKGNLPKSCRGLARYLARYIASPPISVKRILGYNGEEVTYWYNDHKTKMKKIDPVSALVFIGRMVQHIDSSCLNKKQEEILFSSKVSILTVNPSMNDLYYHLM